MNINDLLVHTFQAETLRGALKTQEFPDILATSANEGYNDKCSFHYLNGCEIEAVLLLKEMLFLVAHKRVGGGGGGASCRHMVYRKKLSCQ